MNDRKYQTYPSRFSEGKVHNFYYDRENKTYYIGCVTVGKPLPHGREVKPETPVTCVKCGGPKQSRPVEVIPGYVLSADLAMGQ